MSSTKTADANVVYFNASILYHIQNMQSVSDDELIVRYPDNIFVSYKDITEGGIEITATVKNKNKAFSADAVATATIDDIFSKIVDDIKTAQQDEVEIEDLAAFAKERPGSLTVLTSMAKLTRNEDFNGDMKAKFSKAVISNIKRKCKVTGRGRHSVTDKLKVDVAEKFMTWMFHAAKHVAAALIFNRTQSISKYSDNAINVGFFMAALAAGAKLSDIYTLANSCETWQVVTKVIVKKASPVKGEESAAKGGKKKKQIAEVSDDDDEDDAKPKRGAKKVTKKKVESEDEDSEEEAPKKASKKKQTVESDDEAPPKKSSKKPAAIDEDEDDEDAADDEE